MKKYILLCFALVLLFALPCYADDVSSGDVSENEIVSELPDVPFLSLSSEQEYYEPEVIDYSEYLDYISCYFCSSDSYEVRSTEVIDELYSSFIFHCDFTGDYYDSSTFTFTYFSRSSGEITETVSITEFLSYWLNEEISDSNYSVFLSNDSSLNEIRFYDGNTLKMVMHIGTPSVPNSSIADYDVISIDYMELVPEFIYAPTRDQIDTLNENLLSLKDSSDTITYLLLFLVLERVLYIAWDLFPERWKK